MNMKTHSIMTDERLEAKAILVMTLDPAVAIESVAVLRELDTMPT